MMKYNNILYDVSFGILTLTLNRPKQLNAFTPEMADELIHAFSRASDDIAVSAIVVTGKGRAFCAGMDLSADGNVFGLAESMAPTLEELSSRLDDPDMVAGVRDTGGRVSLAIFDCKKPVIGAINGAAVGVGATMTLAMDIRLASVEARIGFVFTSIGITPEGCSTWFLPRIVGMSKALEWTYSGGIMDADEALAGDLVKAIVPPENLLDEAYIIAKRIAQHSQVSIALTRQMMYRNSALPHPIEAHIIESLAVYATSQKDGKEGVQAFMEKRPAEFSDSASSDMPDFYPWWKNA
jgi:enoyl-CoA hydratase/carnithine racemase